MPYYIINRYKVFLPHKRWAMLNTLAMGNKGPLFRVKSTMAGHSAAREADKLRFRYLTQVCGQDSQTFYKEWVEFDLRDLEAQDNAWDLLYDYCALYRIGYVLDMRSGLQAIAEDLVGDSYAYPMGKVFGLQIHGGHTLRSLLHLKPRPMATLVIDTSQIVRASGSLEDFQLQFRHCVFHCNKNLSIVPAHGETGTPT